MPYDVLSMPFDGTSARIRTAATSIYLQGNQRSLAATRKQPALAFKAATLDRSVTPPGFVQANGISPVHDPACVAMAVCSSTLS